RSEEPHPAIIEHFAQGAHDALNAGMVGGDPVPHESIRSGKLLEQVDRNVKVFRGFAQEICGEDPCRAGTNDCETKRVRVHASFLWRMVTSSAPVYATEPLRETAQKHRVSGQFRYAHRMSVDDVELPDP